MLKLPRAVFLSPLDLEIKTLRGRISRALEDGVPNYPIQVWVGHFPEKARERVKVDLEGCGWSVGLQQPSDERITSGPTSLGWELSPRVGTSVERGVVVELVAAGG